MSCVAGTYDLGPQTNWSTSRRSLRGSAAKLSGTLGFSNTIIGNAKHEKFYCLVLFFIASLAFNADAATSDVKSITIVMGQECACGNHSGGCDAHYKNKKVELVWSMGNSSSKILCPKYGTYGASSISGSEIKINGK